MTMLDKINRFIKENGLIDPKDRVLVALSGGPDSCALLLVLMRLAGPLGLTVAAAHFNHESRLDESDQDEAFCRDLAQSFGAAFFSEEMGGAQKPRGWSTEEFYRQKRYDFLRKTAAQWGADKIALGHHLGDQAETVLLNLIRGGGPAGLRGFLPIRDGLFVRPLMETSRSEIEIFLESEGLAWRRDLSNQSDAHLRNRVRLELIPLLKKRFNPSIEKTLARCAEIFRLENEYIRNMTDQAMADHLIRNEDGSIEFPVCAFLALPPALRNRMAKKILESFSVESERLCGGASFRHVQALNRLAESSSTGKWIALPGAVQAHKDYDRIIVRRGRQEFTAGFSYPVTVPGKLVIEETGQEMLFMIGTPDDVDFSNAQRICLDLDRIVFPVLARNRRRGDKMQPLGMEGTRKVHDLFIDRKIPRSVRDRIVLLSDDESVIWIDGFPPAERVSISPATRRVLIIGNSGCPPRKGPGAQQRKDLS